MIVSVLIFPLVCWIEAGLLLFIWGIYVGLLSLTCGEYTGLIFPLVWGIYEGLFSDFVQIVF